MSATVKFSSKMDAKVLDKLRAHAKASGRTLASVLDDAAAEYLERVLVRPVFRRSTERVLDRNAELLSRLAK